MNDYNGPTFIINGGTLNANTPGALPTSTLSAVTINGSSTLALGASQSVASLSGTSGSTVNLNANTLTINGSSTTTYSGGISGTGNLVKNGSGTQTLAGATTFNGTTTINGTGTLTAATANALGGTTQIDLNGGSLLVAAANAMNANANINLIGGTLAFGSAGYNGSVGALTLSRDSIIDLGTSSNGVLIRFNSINWNDPNALLSIYNWTGNTFYQGGYDNNLDKVIFTNTTLSASQLSKISFYSGIDQSSFVGDATQITASGLFQNQIIAVPEPTPQQEMRKFLEAFGIPVPEEPSAPAILQEVEAPAPQPIPEPEPAQPVLVAKRKPVPRQTHQPVPIIKSPATLRQAIIWREILGPPRSLQSY